MTSPSLSLKSYSVGIICALEVEKAAVDAVLDEEHPVLPTAGDENCYTFGRIGAHNVVVACLPAGVMGKASAAVVARDMMRSFPIKIGLLVGICGAVGSEDNDVRLGDVIVSQPDGQHGGVVQWDFGKMEKDGVFRRTGTLDKPPRVLLNALQNLKAKHRRHGNELYEHLQEMIRRYPLMADEFSHPGQDHDVLFKTDYTHMEGSTCSECDLSQQARRQAHRPDDKPRIHYGNIASGDEVVKDAHTRDRIARQERILCFEMEAAGLMDSFPCVVIRGVCDYADSHKNKRWQPYAAATAASYAKELLGVVNPQGVEDLGLACDTRYRIPFSLKGIPLADHFVPRNHESQQLDSFFQPTSQPAQRSYYVVHGLGGIGKTQLCVDFARRHQKTYSAIFWLDGSSRDALQQSLVDAQLRLQHRQNLSSTMNVQDKIDDLFQWLSLSDNNHWLLIFDNVDRDSSTINEDPQAYHIDSFLPQADHGSILVTTRLSRMHRPEASLNLGPASRNVAREMVEAQTSRELDDMELLLEKLGGLPLALIQAGAFLKETNMSVSEYLNYYDKTWSKLMEAQEERPRRDYGDQTMLTTWKISYDRIKAVSPSAAKLLDLWAFLHPGDIWYKLLECLQNVTAGEITIPTWLHDLAADELPFRRCISVLSQYSLITREIDSNGLSIHPVVHSWSSFNIKSLEEKDELCYFALLMVTEVVSTIGSDQRDLGRRLVPHTRAAGHHFLVAHKRKLPH
ncbi:purine and uridine phosphorylase [Polychaeton citri CBS 116435]|uniref:Purine and uridine phosphorylase n=1 Tax=Polychaeton citri CBS 116435 TaxID=1314669 RepID=A0A9P4UK81_9PEZI|nr:purine and uridine phosphorylase [Polychaeton citri CBS 116435]